MKNNRLLKAALSNLKESERKLIYLLTHDEVRREDVLSFLACYDMDNETAVCSYLINFLLDRFSISEEENKLVPRIRGLKEYFRFHNTAALMKCTPGQTLLDVDLYLKIKYPNEIRPFTLLDGFLSAERFSALFGKRYTERILATAKPAGLQNRQYLLPDDNYFSDIVMLGLYYSMHCEGSAARTVCYIYDMYRYCSDKKTTPWAELLMLRKNIRHKLGRIKRWLLK